MKNRMREIRTSGSVRGEEGNLLPYSTFPRVRRKGGNGPIRRLAVPGAISPRADRNGRGAPLPVTLPRDQYFRRPD